MKLLVSLLLLTISVAPTCLYAAQSDFERGYYAGLGACTVPNTLVVCTLPATQYYGSAITKGYNKIDALKNVSADYLADLTKEGKKYTCMDITP